MGPGEPALRVERVEIPTDGLGGNRKAAYQIDDTDVRRNLQFEQDLCPSLSLTQLSSGLSNSGHDPVSFPKYSISNIHAQECCETKILSR